MACFIKFSISYSVETILYVSYAVHSWEKGFDSFVLGYLLQGVYKANSLGH